MKTNAKIYVMRAEDGTLKLGVSNCPERRAKQVGRAVEVVHTTDVVEEAERIERLAHRVLALHGEHLRGEWFKADISAAIQAIEIALKQAEGEQLALGGRLKREAAPRSERELLRAKRCRQWRDHVGLTQEGAARRLGMTLRNWQNYESGAYQPPVAVLMVMTAIAKGIDLEPWTVADDDQTQGAP